MTTTTRPRGASAGVRATVTLGEEVHEAVQEAAARAGLTVPEYLRRALALQRALDKYMDDDTLTVLDPNRDNAEVHLQLV